MNSKIRDLAESAMGTRKHVPPVWQFFDDELEDFTALIVEQCIKEVYPEWMKDPSNGVEPTNLADAVNRILDTFGVKNE